MTLNDLDRSRLFTIEEVAKLLLVTPDEVKLFVRSGKLRAKKFGTGAHKYPWRFTAENVQKFLDETEE